MKFRLPKHESEAPVQFKGIKLLTINYLANWFNILLAETREQMSMIGLLHAVAEKQKF